MLLLEQLPECNYTSTGKFNQSLGISQANTRGRYQYGKYFPHIGPQTRYPIPPGILNLQGSNTLSVAVWSQTDAGAKLSTLRLISYASYESGFDFAGIDGKQLQPSWQDRSQYA